MALDSEEAKITSADRIKQLSDLEQDVVQLLSSAGLALKALSPSSLLSPDDPLHTAPPSIEEQKQAFSAATTEYFRRLSSLDVGLRTQIQALEEARIIADEIATKDQSNSAGSGKYAGLLGVPAAAPKPTTGGRSGVNGGGLGNLDVGWLNSRNDYVAKNMEAEILKKAAEFLAGLES
ncbi:MAG: hypothetical protein Q9195_006895 [Heterodermia aff. obscurata]